MTEEAVVSRVGDLMATLDDLKRYRELANAMVDFAGIIVASLIAVVALLIFQNAYTIASGPAFGSELLTLSPVSTVVTLAAILALVFGIVAGAYRVNARVKSTRVGEWRETLKEGTPGAVKLLEETDWDSTLRMISLSRPAYLFYALIKTAAYSALVSFVLFFVGDLSGFLTILQTGPVYILLISITVVLLLSWRGLALGFRRMQSLDFLYWDLRVFSTEFKRAEFNQA